MADMGMTMDHMDMGAMDHSALDMEGMDHGAMDHGAMDHGMMDHGTMDHSAMGHGAGMAAPPAASVERGPGVANVADSVRNRLAEPGTGLEDVGHRVLAYADLKAATAEPEPEAGRELELHLTGNMERYMWSFDGEKFSEVTGPIPFRHGERVRLHLVNDTMMEHPIHLHGMWMRLDAGHGARNPKKHTISVKPAERLSVLIEADAPGDWAFHCHLLYHMQAGMFRVVRVGEPHMPDMPGMPGMPGMNAAG
jgi:FtsP/CotA-like multicopper oxidase with cupredoxin domain